MKWRNTLILVFVLLALAAYVFFVERDREPPSTAGESPTPGVRVVELDATKVVRFEIRGAISSTVLVRGEMGAPWKLEAPVADEADDARVSRAVERLTDLTARRVISETGESPETFGLAEPQMEITVTTADGQERRLFIGGETPQGSAYYVQRPGEPTIYLIQTSIVAEIQRFAETPPVKPTPTATWTPLPTVEPIPTMTPTLAE